MLKELRGQILVWFGIVGSAVTIAGHWPDILKLSEWMRWLVSHFSEAMHVIWKEICSWIGLEISLEAATFLSFVFFSASMTIGSVILAQKFRTRPSVTALVITLCTFIAILAAPLGIQNEFENISRWSVIVMLIASIVTLSEGRSSEKLISTIIVILYFCVFLSTFSKAEHFIMQYGNFYWKHVFDTLMISAAILIPLMLAPTKALLKRMVFVLIGVAAIFGLSEVSKVVEHLSTAATTISTHKSGYVKSAD
jgi:hypothetical protein